MYDLSLETELAARVDALGNARRTRRLIFTNRTRDQLDLTGWQMWFHSTDPNIQVKRAFDSHDVPFSPEISYGDSGQLRVTCNVNTKLEPAEVYWLQVEYEQAEYFVRLPKSNCWLVNEWFARSGTINSDPYIVGEPHRYSYTVHIPDIRWGAFGIKDPTRVLEVDTNRVGSVKRGPSGVCLEWHLNLGPDERSGEIYVLYHVKARWWLLTPLFSVAGAAAATVAWGILQAVLG